MNVKTVDFFEVMNMALVNVLEMNHALIITQAFDELSVSMTDFEAEINLVIKMLQGNAFRENYRLVIVNGNTPCTNYLVKHENLLTNQVLSKHVMVDEYARKFFKSAGLILPSSAGVESLYNQMFGKLNYKNIFWLDLNMDYTDSHDALFVGLQDHFTRCSKLNMLEVFSRDNVNEILITSYEFYNNKYPNAIDKIMTDDLFASIKTEVDCFIRSCLN